MIAAGFLDCGTHGHCWADYGSPRKKPFPGGGPFTIEVHQQSCFCGAQRTRTIIQDRTIPARPNLPTIRASDMIQPTDREARATIVHRFGRTIRHDRAPAVRTV